MNAAHPPLRAVIAHCWQGGPGQGWYPWAAAALRAQGIDVHVPALPTPRTPRRAAWTAALDRAMGEPGGPRLLIGHSLGALAALHWLAASDARHEILGLLLVAPPLQATGIAEVDAFLAPAPDVAAIARRVRHKSVLVSDADPYLRPSPQWIAQSLADHGFEVLSAPGLGHFAPASGLKALPALAEWSQRFAHSFA